MADEGVIVSASGVSARDQFLSLVESGELTHSAMTNVSRPRIRVYGDTAVLTGQVTSTAHYKWPTLRRLRAGTAAGCAC
nr:hypothetical protein [Streptomyces sp. MB09-02B]